MILITLFISCKNESEVMKILTESSFGKSSEELAELNFRAAEQLIKLKSLARAEKLYDNAIILKAGVVKR